MKQNTIFLIVFFLVGVLVLFFRFGYMLTEPEKALTSETEAFQSLSFEEQLSVVLSEGGFPQNHVEFNEERGVLHISMVSKENVTMNMTKDGMHITASDILEAFQPKEGFEEIHIYCYLPTIDSFGREATSLAMEIRVTKETLWQINFENFLSMNLPDVVDYYWFNTNLLT